MATIEPAYKRWTEQELKSLPVWQVFPVARDLVLDALSRGVEVGRGNFDQNADNHTEAGYIGISNKQLKMATSKLLFGDGRDVNMDLAWAFFMWSAFGIGSAEFVADLRELDVHEDIVDG